MADWTTINEELYNNVGFFGDHPLAMGKQDQGGNHIETTVVAWTNEKFGARTFSTTIGHNNATVADARYLDLVVRGVLWSANKLNDQYLTAYKGPEGKFTTLDAPKKEEKKPEKK
jgi:type 1 glutamine amidotransferase